MKKPSEEILKNKDFKDPVLALDAKEILEKLKKNNIEMKDLKKLGFSVDFFRSPGPGGQNINKVETGVRIKCGPLNIDIKATEERSQFRNFQIAVLRLRKILEKMTKTEKPRITTKPTKSAKKERMEEKKKTSEKKKLRAKPSVYGI